MVWSFWLRSSYPASDPIFQTPFVFGWGSVSSSHQWNTCRAPSRQRSKIGCTFLSVYPVCWLIREESEILKEGRATRGTEAGPQLVTQQATPTATLALDCD